MFQIPNTLTLLRILLVPVFAIAFVIPGEAARLTAFVVFCIAGLSDALDGFAARKLNAGTDFGRMLDPIADKILVGVALMMLVAEGQVREFNLTMGLGSLLKLVPALIILAREILVSGLREFLAGVSVSVPVSSIAKLKTTIQMVAIGAMILGPIADRWVPGSLALAYIALWFAAVLTVVSIQADAARMNFRPMSKIGVGSFSARAKVTINNAGSGTWAITVSRRRARWRSQLTCSRYMIRRTYASGALWIRPQCAAALTSTFCSRSSAACWSPVSTYASRSNGLDLAATNSAKSCRAPSSTGRHPPCP